MADAVDAGAEKKEVSRDQLLVYIKKLKVRCSKSVGGCGC
jgi:hypothetical protein